MSPKYQAQRPEILSSTDMKTHLDEHKITTENHHECCNGGGRQNTTTLSPFLLAIAQKQQPSEAQSNFTPALRQLPSIGLIIITLPELIHTSQATHCFFYPIAMPQSVFLGYLCDVVPHPFHWEARRKFLFTSY